MNLYLNALLKEEDRNSFTEFSSFSRFFEMVMIINGKYFFYNEHISKHVHWQDMNHGIYRYIMMVIKAWLKFEATCAINKIENEGLS